MDCLVKVGIFLIHISLVDSVFSLEVFFVEMSTCTVVPSKDMAANCAKGPKAPGNGFKRTSSNFWAACLWWCGCCSIPGEEDGQGLEI